MNETITTRDLLSVGDDLIAFRQADRVFFTGGPTRLDSLARLADVIAGLAALGAASCLVVGLLESDRVDLLLAGPALLGLGLLAWSVARRARARSRAGRPSGEAAEVWVVRFERRSARMRVVGPIRERTGEPEFLLGRSRPVALELPFDRVSLRRSFHRSLPWSDAYDDGDDEHDAIHLALRVDAPGTPFDGEFDLLGDVPRDGGFAVVRWNPEAIRRTELAERLLGVSPR